MFNYADNSSQRRPPVRKEIQVALNLIPAHTWYGDASGALTFVNERYSDYLGLPKDHPLRSGIDSGATWDSHISFLHPDDRDEIRRVWSTCLRTNCAGQVSFRVRNAVGLSLFTDFENFTVFKPAPMHDAEVNAMLDQVIAWSGALRSLRNK